MDGFDESLLTQKFAKGEVRYYLRQGLIFDRSQSTTVFGSSTSVYSVTNIKTWIKWDDPNIADMDIVLPDFAMGHRLLMLGATVINDSKTVQNINRLAVWNIDTKKGYLLYSQSNVVYDSSKSSNLDLLKIPKFICTTKDLAVRKIGSFVLLFGVVAAGIYGLFLKKHGVSDPVNGFILALTAFFLIKFVIYWTARETRNEILSRVWEISRSLKYEINAKA